MVAFVFYIASVLLLIGLYISTTQDVENTRREKTIAGFAIVADGLFVLTLLLDLNNILIGLI